MNDFNEWLQGHLGYLEAAYKVLNMDQYTLRVWELAQPQWHPIETAPKSGMMVRVGWWAGGEWYEDLDFFEDEVWHNYTNHYEHFCAAGSVPGMVGPKEEAPYQYWMPLPQPPKS